jgi:hypothetical protein
MPIVLFLIALLPFKQSPLWHDPAEGMTGIKYIGGLCAVYAVIHAAMAGRMPPYLRTWQARWYLLFTLVVCLSYARSGVTFFSTFNPLLTVVSLLFLYLILPSVVDSVRRLRWVVLAAVGSGAWASLYVIREWQMNHGWDTGEQMGWLVGDTNHFGVSGICCLTLAWYMTRSRRPGWERWFSYGCLLVTLAGLIVAGSRGGLLGLGTALLFMTIRAQERRWSLLAVLALAVAFNIVYPHSPLQRILHSVGNEDFSEQAHRASWQAGLAMVRDYPITGVGFGEFKAHMLQYAPDFYDAQAYMAHNAYISVAAEMGIPGLFLFLGVLAATYVSLEGVRRKSSAPLLVTQTAAALQAGLVGNSVTIFFISAEYHEHLWFAVFLSMCLPPLAKRFARTPARTDAHGDSEPDLDPEPILTSFSAETSE